MSNSSYHLFVQTYYYKNEAGSQTKSSTVARRRERTGINYLFLLKATCIGERLQTSLVTCGSLSVLLVYGIIDSDVSVTKL